MVNYNSYSDDSFNFTSAALITFIQNYYTQDTEQSLIKDAERISVLLEESDNKALAIKHSKALIEGPSGLIIMKNKTMNSIIHILN